MWTDFINFLRWLRLVLTRFGKRISPQSLFSRSMVILVTPVVLTMGIGLFVFFDRHWSTTTANLTNSLAGEIAMVTEAWENEPDIRKRDILLQTAYKKLGIRIDFSHESPLTITKRLRVMGVQQSLERSLISRLDSRKFSVHAYHENDDTRVQITVAVTDGILKFTIPKKRLFSTTTYVFLLFMVGSGLLLSIIAVIFMRNQIRPVNRLAVVAEQFGKGIDSPAFRPTGAREVRQAAQAFLEMRERIKRQIRQRTDMLSGVSHDLRTPLTRLKLQLAMLPQNADTADDLAAMQDDIQAMERMIKAYLDFARDETMERPLRCNVVDLLQQAVQDSARQGFTVHTDLAQEAIAMTVRPQGIRRVFANLLENARLYAHHSWVTVNRLSRSIEIIVDDDGPGIPLEKREDAFKPFHRVDEARNQDIEGTGLGLTIARDIVQSHGGTISLDSSPHGGLRVIVWLPL